MLRRVQRRFVSERDRRIYAKAYAQRGAMRAGFEVFRAFERGAPARKHRKNF
jgi:hypothetical protein